MPFKPQEQVKKNFARISVSLASSDAILSRSYGEVTKPETINYRSFRPEKDGLFCEKIFGPVRDWECHCGKYKRIRYKGIICDRCGVEVTQKSVRRERMGHISLAVPIVHIWYFRSLPSKIANILGVSSKELERIIYYENYVVISPGPTSFPKPFGALDEEFPEIEEDEKVDKALFRNDLTLLTEDEYLEVLDGLPEENFDLDDDDPEKFVALIGGEAIKGLLRSVDIEKLADRLRYQIRYETSQQKRQEAIKRLRVVSAFTTQRDGDFINRPEWMVLDVIPVIPPELRPLVPLEGGRFATSDLNDLYRRVIIRNNRLKRLIDIKAPEVILRNEKRMLQEAVDSLFDNSRRVNSVRSDNNRALKSLSDMLKGKQGRFRQNLLGKRVDYSGRSVIVVGPELKLHQCGLPKDMAVELFKPFIIRKLIERGIVKTVKSAKKVVDKKGPEVWDILEKIIDGHPVLLNRAPTLHRLGIQAFQPLLVEGKAIRLHPLVCTAFNADFDGDQMAVHVPLSFDAQLESSILLLSSHNILSPQNGNPIAIPSQEMVLGCYYITKALPGDEGEGMLFGSIDEAVIAFDQRRVGLHARVKVRVPLALDRLTEGGPTQEIVDTTMGRILFNRIVPTETGFINEILTKRRLVQVVSLIFHKMGNLATTRFLDDLKDLGFGYATLGGLSISVSDVEIPKEKTDLISKAQSDVENIMKQYQMGFITNGERYNKVIDIWTRTTNRVADKLFDTLQRSQNGFNSLYMMMDSGARGSKEQVRQLAGMRGLMAKPQKSMTGQTGEIIENPIVANFRDGLSVLEYFISTHGARKGLADTALKTADAGYLTRRLVDVAQDVAITEFDCNTIRGVEVEALKEGEDIKEPLAERILGRVSLYDVKDPLTGDLLVKAGEMIDEKKAEAVAQTSLESVVIRSVLTCEARHGACTRCYGRNLTTGRLVDVGEAVGIIAAQSIGEPGTQLTLRTFHVGGTASRIAAQSQISTRFDGRVQFEGLKTVVYTDDLEDKIFVVNRNGIINILDDDNRVLSKYDIPYGSTLLVEEKQQVARGEVLYEWDPYNATILAAHTGRVRYADLYEGRTFREEPDDQTGHIQKVVSESKDKTLNPRIQVVNDKGDVLAEYNTPVRANLTVDDGQAIIAGTVLVKIPREIGKTRDITGGLPRVTELFEARSSQNPSIVSEIDGTVTFGAQKRGSREIIVTSHDGSDIRTYLAPIGRHVLVQVNDVVKAGERLTDGSINPHDILSIKGAGAVQEYLVNEIQEVYRMQGVRINDKHIEIIVRQMLQKVRIVSPGDTQFLEGDVVERPRVIEENSQLEDKVVIFDKKDSKFKKGQQVSKKKVREVGFELKKKSKESPEFRESEPANYEPILLGITQASLTTESFISAASFQETTKVLTEAAIAGKVDDLLGLKENVIIGHLIPAGTGLKKFRNIIVTSMQDEAEEAVPAEELVPAAQ
ncbi:MAG: DNA-directed RNA polymerase subunit beta' [Ignavibacteria bacterium]|nr:MAG: DNA-directed RNA polymerase subunit beta' [Ignavibacteria bacterium]